MNSYGSIIVISYQKRTLKTIMDQLHEISLHQYFNFQAQTVDEISHSSVNHHTLVLVSSKIVAMMVKPYLNENTPVIVAKRNINYSKIRDILELPQGNKILLVSDLKEAAKDAVSMLKDNGIPHEFVSYYPGVKMDPSIKFALTPGEPQLVPDTVEKVVDIGPRFIDISTIIEIFIYFKLPSHTFNHLSARYMQSLVHVTTELNHEIFTSKILRYNMEQIIHTIEDGTLLFRNDGTILNVNRKAVELLELEGKQIDKKPIGEVLASNFVQLIQQLDADHNSFVDIDKVTYYIRKKEIYVDKESYGTLILFRKAEEIQQIEYSYRKKLRAKNHTATQSFSDIITNSPSMFELIQIAKELSKSSSTILILGETGTGKEVLTQAIHNASPRMPEPFVGVNFASISENLMESELFGYEAGAFTGASKNGRKGLFEQAHKGTVFLDEIGDASPVIQKRLLRILQEKQIIRVGGEQVISLDVRVIAATNKSLETMREEGTFREDLFYRLNVLPLYIPPLRKRVEDIALLTDIFNHEIAKKLKREQLTFSNEAIKAMKEYQWPGNIRELQNAIEYLAHFVKDTVYKEHLPFISKSGLNLTHNHNQKLVENLKKRGFLDESVLILKSLRRSAENSQGLGRNKLIELLAEININLSEQQLRYRQKLLKEQDLIIIHRGRQGSEITDRGKQFIEYYHNL